MNIAHFLFGIFGDASGLFLFLAPTITFKRIIANKSTEKFSDEDTSGGKHRKFRNDEDAVLGKISDEYESWEQQDQHVFTWLLASMSQDLHARMVDSEFSFFSESPEPLQRITKSENYQANKVSSHGSAAAKHKQHTAAVPPLTEDHFL